MMRIIYASIGLVVLLLVGAGTRHYFYQTVYMVPAVNYTSTYDAFSPARRIAATDPYYAPLRRRFPSIQKISPAEVNEALNKGTTVLMPWSYLTPAMKLLHIDKQYMYESANGAIPVRCWMQRRARPLDRNMFTVMTAAGTVVLGRGVHRAVQRNQDVFWPWKGTAHLFQRSDFAMVNFKSPLVKGYQYPESSWVLTAPDQYAAGLSAAGIDLVSLSGNHMGDGGMDGLMNTISVLHDLNIKSVGAGQTHAHAYRPVIWEHRGTRFGYLAFNSVPGSVQKAGKSSIGIAWLDQDAIHAVSQLDSQVDYVIVMANWGTEYKATPNIREIRMAEQLIAAGADIVLGDQAHWVQNYWMNNGRYIAYGLGNFIFDQHWSKKTTEGIIQQFVFYKAKLLTIRTIPVVLRRDGQVTIVPPSAARQEILSQYYGE